MWKLIDYIKMKRLGLKVWISRFLHGGDIVETKNIKNLLEKSIGADGIDPHILMNAGRYAAHVLNIENEKLKVEIQNINAKF